MTDLKPIMPRYEVYKDSGVEWIGKIPRHWEVIALKFLLKERLKYGANESGIQYNPRLPRYIRITDFSESGKLDESSKLSLTWSISKEYLLSDGDILFARSGATVGKSYQFKKTMSFEKAYAFAGYLIKATPSTDSILSDYLKYYSDSNLFKEWREIIFNKATIENISADKYAQLPVIVPILKEQTTIANFLDCKTTKIDQAVTIKEKQIQLLKERKQTLIQNAVTRGLDPDAPMRDSGVEWIGVMPEHWRIAANRTLFKERVEPGKDELPLLSVSIHSGISDKEVSEEENIRGRVKIEDKTKYNLVEPSDIVFNMMRAWQGALGSAKVKGMVSPAYIIAEPIGEIHSPYFEYQYRCPIFIQQMDRFSKGITDFRKRLYWNEFKQLLTVVPPLEEQKAIVSHIQTQSVKINKAIAIQEQMIEKLKEYKATLINSAVTGKIKVPGAGPTTGEEKAVA